MNVAPVPCCRVCSREVVARHAKPIRRGDGGVSTHDIYLSEIGEFLCGKCWFAAMDASGVAMNPWTQTLPRCMRTYDVALEMIRQLREAEPTQPAPAAPSEATARSSDS